MSLCIVCGVARVAENGKVPVAESSTKAPSCDGLSPVTGTIIISPNLKDVYRATASLVAMDSHTQTHQ